MTKKRIVGCRYISQFLFDSGLLYEINRTVLHPLGISIYVSITDDDATCTEDIMISIDDDDYEGCIFDANPVGYKKLTDFLQSIEAEKRVATRLAALGFVVQPYPEGK